MSHGHKHYQPLFFPPLFSYLILIAVTIVIGIAVAGWLMGVWGTFGGGEALKIYPSSELISSQIDGSGAATLRLVLFNIGEHSAKILEIRVGNKKCAQLSEKLVRPGERKEIMCAINAPSEIRPGIVYDVFIVTEAGNLFAYKIKAKYVHGENDDTEHDDYVPPIAYI